jgi:DMSO/TMAO reductase YedYZ molybdopterin-dependent catalytic subunit
VLDVPFTYILKKKWQMKKIFISALTILLISIVILAFSAFNYAQFNVRAESGSQININGLVSHPFNFTLADLQAMPQTTVQAILYCVSAPTTPLEKGNWQGVKL